MLARLVAMAPVAAVLTTVMLASVLAGSAAAGRAIQPETSGRTVWDGVYTEEQATRGHAVYQKECASCHLEDLRGEGFAPSLIEDAFTYRWQDGPLGDLLIVTKATMPADRPATLPDEQYAEVVAYLLKMNKYPAGPRELSKNPSDLTQVTFKKPGASAKP